MTVLAVTALDVAITSAIAAGVTGVAAPFAAWLIAKQTTGSTRRIAEEERIYASRIDAYDEAMTIAYQAQGIAIQLVEAMEKGLPEPAFETPYVGVKMLEIAGRMEVRGKAATAQALVDVSRAAVAFATLWTELGGPFSQQPPEDVRQQLYAKRDEVKDARQTLGNLVRADLGHA